MLALLNSNRFEASALPTLDSIMVVYDVRRPFMKQQATPLSAAFWGLMFYDFEWSLKLFNPLAFLTTEWVIPILWTPFMGELMDRDEAVSIQRVYGKSVKYVIS